MTVDEMGEGSWLAWAIDGFRQRTQGQLTFEASILRNGTVEESSNQDTERGPGPCVNDSHVVAPGRRREVDGLRAGVVSRKEGGSDPEGSSAADGLRDGELSNRRPRDI